LGKKLLIASAGAGKTHLISDEACQITKDEKRVLIITYTESNQREIIAKYKSMGGAKRGRIVVKGWFTFLLEDIIRPYQNEVFSTRIGSINFTSSNPHRRGNFTVKGTAEKVDGNYNPRHFLTNCKTKAHTEFLSKLATVMAKESKLKPIKRLSAIYQKIFIDEVQDLAGWDFDFLKLLSKSTTPITCVGDFRQTIYSTTSNPKKPSTNQEKMDSFKSLGFEIEAMAVSRRCIQSICDFADEIHAGSGYTATKTLVDEIPARFQEHQGIFIVPKSKLHSYIEKYTPVILRNSINSAKELNELPIEKINFGISKGLGFDRTMVITTKNINAFLKGDKTAFDSGKSDKSKNNFYVACTRSRYSLAFLVEDKDLDAINFPLWK
jgi:superfamily I DNA/RNA helicase